MSLTLGIEFRRKATDRFAAGSGVGGSTHATRRNYVRETDHRGNLRRRAGRVRRLMGGMVEKANYDRLLEYAVGLEIRATELERGDQ